MTRDELGISNFSRALGKLELFLSEVAKTEREQAGIIQAFEFCFEVTWKCLQKKAAKEKLAIASHKKAFEYALQAGLIPSNEERDWAQMLEDRNLTTHTYEEALAKLIASRIPRYRDLMKALIVKLRS